MAQPCENCRRGTGPFEDGCFTGGASIAHGACGNCHYNSEGKRCTYHSSKQQEEAAKESAKESAKSAKRDRKRKRAMQREEEEDSDSPASPKQQPPPAFNPTHPPWANAAGYTGPYSGPGGTGAQFATSAFHSAQAQPQGINPYLDANPGLQQYRQYTPGPQQQYTQPIHPLPELPSPVVDPVLAERPVKKAKKTAESRVADRPAPVTMTGTLQTGLQIPLNLSGMSIREGRKFIKVFRTIVQHLEDAVDAAEEAEMEEG